jgi:hypothetical protein
MVFSATFNNISATGIQRVYNAPWDTQVQMFKWYVSSRIVYKDKHKKQRIPPN